MKCFVIVVLKFLLYRCWLTRLKALFNNLAPLILQLWPTPVLAMGTWRRSFLSDIVPCFSYVIMIGEQCWTPPRSASIYTWQHIDMKDSWWCNSLVEVRRSKFDNSFRSLFCITCSFCKYSFAQFPKTSMSYFKLECINEKYSCLATLLDIII